MALSANSARLARFAAPLRCNSFSTGRVSCMFKPLVDVERDDELKIATVSLNKSPVNSFNLELSRQFSGTVLELSKDKKNVKGLVVTSSVPGLFSAGLDLASMYKAEEDDLRDFWNAFQDTWWTLYTCPVPIVSALNGHTIAGGAMVATVTDYRVMVRGKFQMGLNEAKFGLVAPFWFMDSFVAAVGYRNAELALLRGTLFSPEEALKVGLVDELVDSQEEAVARCKEEVVNFTKTVPMARHLTKMQARKHTLDYFQKHRQSDTDNFVKLVTSEQIQNSLGLYLESLKNKSKK